MWKGQITFETPMLFACGFLVTFLFGGLTGVILAAPALDFHVSDTYFVVAHFHYVLFGTIVFATFAGIYFWFPKMTGRFLDERLGRLHFWTTFIGFHITFLIQHWLGNIGMPRRYPDYLPTDGFTTLNTISTIGVVRARRLDAAVPVERGQVLAVRRDHHRRRPLGVRQLPGMGHQFARRRGTTSSRCPGSAPNGPRSNCTTRTWSTGCGPRRTRTAAGSRCRPPSPARTWPSELPRTIRARRPHKPRCRLSGRFSRRFGASPPPAPGSARWGGPQTNEIRIRPTRSTEHRKRFERHEHGVGIIGIGYPAGGVGGRDGPVTVQHPAVAVPALPGPHRGPPRPGPPVDRPRPRRPGTADRLRRSTVQPPAGPARTRRHPGGDR